MLITISQNTQPACSATAIDNRARCCILRRAAWLLLFGAVILQSCSYHLPAFVPTSTLSLRIIAADPTQYTIRFDNGDEHKLGDDGKVTLTLPSYRPSCSVYFLGIIKVRGYRSPEIQIVKKPGQIIRTIAVNKISELPIGSDGYRLLKVK
jgi:hypothetical protein